MIRPWKHGSTLSSASSTISTSALERIVDRLKCEQYRSSTRKNYYSVWKNFNSFFLRLDNKPTSWEHRVLLFLGYLVNEKKKSSTIKSYVSAIRAVLAEVGHHLKEDKYTLHALTRACCLTNDKMLLRFPTRQIYLLL